MFIDEHIILLFSRRNAKRCFVLAFFLIPVIVVSLTSFLHVAASFVVMAAYCPSDQRESVDEQLKEHVCEITHSPLSVLLK